MKREAINSRAIRVLLGRCEAEFDECWDILVAMRKGRIDPRVATFQSTLACSMYRLAKAHRRIGELKRDTIGRKTQLATTLIAKRLKRLDEYRTLLEDAIGIGKGLGDAFAWFFYQNDSLLLAEHAKEQRQRVMSGGIGTRGEIEFVAAFPLVGDFFVLYHNITTILRTGDISLVQLAPLKIVALGELKSGAVRDGEMDVELSIVSSPPLVFEVQDREGRPKQARALVLNAAGKARLQRQLKRMQKGLSESTRRKIEDNLELSTSQYLNELEQLVRKTRMGTLRAGLLGGGLAAAVYRSKRRTIFGRLKYTSQDLVPLLDESISRSAADTILKGSANNAIVTGALHFDSREGQPSLLLGTIPLFWTSLPLDTIKDIYFSRIVVLTIFNPAHLLAALEAAGFLIHNVDSPGQIVLEQHSGERTFHLGNFAYFLNLIPRALFREEQVVDLIRQTFRGIAERDLGPGVRIGLHFDHRLGSPPTPQ